jgi:hypothetical protein
VLALQKYFRCTQPQFVELVLGGSTWRFPMKRSQWEIIKSSAIFFWSSPS